MEHPDLAEQLMNYDAFTDIVFNPEKSLNCQAMACAYYVALRKMNLVQKALETPENFLQIVYLQKYNPAHFKKAFGTSPVLPFVAPPSEENTPLSKTPDPDSQPSVPEKSFQSVLKPGMKMIHPKFGLGKITHLETYNSSSRVTIEFENTTKTLDEKWILSKCRQVE